MTEDREQRIRDAFHAADSAGARIVMAEFVIGVFREIAAVRETVESVEKRTFSAEDFNRIQADLRDGAFWNEAAKRLIAGLKGMVAVALAVAAFWAMYEVAMKFLTLMKGGKP